MQHIPRLTRRLQTDFRYTPIVAAEIEFYLHGSEGKNLDELWRDVAAACAEASIAIHAIEKERGYEQHEISLQSVTAAKAAGDAAALKTIVARLAAAHGMQADFSAKPLSDQPGSGLHIHIHLEDETGKNVFYKDDQAMSPSLKYSIGGLLAWLPDCMPIFAPAPESYVRFVPGSNAPITVSWGANNRTVAIRLPDKPHANKHIEHRAAGADADPAAVIAVILAAMHDGLTRALDPGPQIYGNAGLPDYKLPKLPITFEEAQERMNASMLLPDYFDSGTFPV